MQGLLAGQSWRGMACGNATATAVMWFGVTCKDGNVVSVILESMRLAGPLPALLTEIALLQNVSFYNNSLSGIMIMRDVLHRVEIEQDTSLTKPQFAGLVMHSSPVLAASCKLIWREVCRHHTSLIRTSAAFKKLVPGPESTDRQANT